MRIKFEFVSHIQADIIKANAEATRKRGLPRVGSTRSGALAVVGGAPNLAESIDELAQWNGDIWAVNGACRFLLDRGIDAVGFSIDPHSEIVPFFAGVKRAIFAESVDQGMFDVIDPECQLEVFALDDVLHGPTSVMATPHLAIMAGYSTVKFFGFGSAYQNGRTHAYAAADFGRRIEVIVDGQSFETAPPFLVQAEFLAELIRKAPGVYSEASGGLLRALIAHPDYDIVAADRETHRQAMQSLENLGA